MSVSDGVIPLGELELSLFVPAIVILGWDVYLAERGIPIVEDDIGRRAIAKADARRLIAEQREAEARS